MLAAIPPAPPASMFPRRKSFQWIEQGNGLWARVGSDGEVIMWRDDTTRDVWMANETPPKKWRKYFKRNYLRGLGEFGAASSAKSIGHLQSALEALSRRVDDHQVATTLDGKMGPLTAAATNRALKIYSSAPANLKTGRLTATQIMTDIASITMYIEQARGIPAKVTSGIYRPQQQQSQPYQTQPAGMPGGAPMPAPTYYQPTYYAQPAVRPPYYPPAQPRGPGGLPTDRASLDIKAFIPAQYEHLRIHPSVPMLVLGGLMIYMVMKDRGKKHHKE